MVHHRGVEKKGASSFLSLSIDQRMGSLQAHED